MRRKRDIREQRKEHDSQRWQQERDEDAEDRDVPDQDDEPQPWERMQ